MSVAAEIREQGRGMAGALLVLGVSFTYTIETWWLAVEIPATHLVGFVAVGLAFVVPVSRAVGFRTDSFDGGGEAETGAGDSTERAERRGSSGRTTDGRADDEQDAIEAEHEGSGEIGEGMRGAIEAGEENVEEALEGTKLPTQFARSPMWVEALEAVFQAFFVAYVTLFLLGVIDPNDPLPVIVRTGLVQVVPLAFGAALANEVLSAEQATMSEAEFPRSLAVFALGAVFFAAPIAPTEEVAILATRATWIRLAGVVVATLVGAYLILYVLEFRGQSGRLEGRSRWGQLGGTCMVYAVGLIVAGGMLLAFTQTAGDPLASEVRRTVLLAFPAAIGASGARVVLA
jgi:putative integral membrane protein (TIGR02587 family)